MQDLVRSVLFASDWESSQKARIISENGELHLGLGTVNIHALKMKRILVVSCRVVLDIELCNKLTAAFQELDATMECHLYKHFTDRMRETKSKSERDALLYEMRSVQCLVMQIDSMWRLEGVHYDVMVIDEGDGVLAQAHKSARSGHNWITLVQQVHATPKVVILDASADEDVAELIKASGRDADTTWIENTFQPYAARLIGRNNDVLLPQVHVNFHWSKKKGEEAILQAFFEGKKVFIASCNEGWASALLEYVRKKFEEKGRNLDQERPGIYFRGDAACDSQHERDMKYKYVQDLTAATKNVHWVIATPTLGRGTDISHGLVSGLVSADPEDLAFAFDVVFCLVDP